MRIAIDGTPFLIEKTGIGHYTSNLIRALKIEQPSLEITAFTVSLRAGHRLKRRMAGLPATPRGFNLPANLLYYRVWPRIKLLPLETLAGEVDVFHATNYQAPALRKAALVSTVHDINFLRYPELQSKGILRFTQSLPGLLARSAAVLADSHFTAGELAELTGADMEKVRVVYPGLDERFRRPGAEAIERALREMGMNSPYIAYVGNMHPRKNLPVLLRAFASLVSRVPHHLAVIGGGGLGRQNDQEYVKLAAEVERLGIRDRVRFTGYVPDEQLPALLSGAELLVLPSLYEGFGLPALEAMACGVPVIVSRRASLPEVVGDAGIYIEDPEDEREVAERVLSLIESPQRRLELAALGLKRASLFSWPEAARRVLDVYREVSA
ncbi:MAG: glycosyltransferase family 4 protein [Candidatus Geothermincolia bacterium]